MVLFQCKGGSEIDIDVATLCADSHEWTLLIQALRSVSTSTASTWASMVQLLTDEWQKLTSEQERSQNSDNIELGLRFTVLYDKTAEEWIHTMQQAGMTSARLQGDAPIVAKAKAKAHRERTSPPVFTTALRLEHANAIAQQVFVHAKAISSRPLCVAVLDAGGHVVSVQRQDGAAFLRVEVAYGKAYDTLGMGEPSSILAKRLEGRVAFQSSISTASGGQFVPAAGGVLVLAPASGAADDHGKVVIGAVGVSGDTSEVDEECAVMGLAAAGLTSVPSAPGSRRKKAARL